MTVIFLKCLILCLMLNNLIVWGSSLPEGTSACFRALFNLFLFRWTGKYFWMIDLWFIYFINWKYYPDIRSKIFSFFSVLISSFFFLLYFCIFHWSFWLYFPLIFQRAIPSVQKHNRNFALIPYLTGVFSEHWLKQNSDYIFSFHLTIMHYCRLSFSFFLPFILLHCTLVYHHSMGTFPN